MTEDYRVSITTIGLTRFFLWGGLFTGLVVRDPGTVILAGGMLAIVYGSRFWSRIALSRVELRADIDRRRVFPGESFSLVVTIANRKIVPFRVRLSFPRASFSEGEISFATYLFPFEQIERRWDLRVPSRGVYPIGQATLTGSDPAGFYQRSVSAPDGGEIVVFPRLLRTTEVEVAFQEYFGINASKGPVEDPAWYAGTREYVGPRPARNIHWKASARLGTMQEKLFEPTSHRKVLFVLDVRGYVGEEGFLADDRTRRGAFESALEAIASLATRFMETGASFGLVTNAGIDGGTHRYLTLGRGPEHLGMLLELLARVTLRRAAPLEELVYQVGRGGTAFVYVGYAPDERTHLFFTLPTTQRRKILFLFSRRYGGEETEADAEPEGFSNDYPSLLIGELIHDE